MAKPKRTPRRPGAAAGQRSPAQQTGTRAGNATVQGTNRKAAPNQKAAPNDNRVTSKATGSAAGTARTSSTVAGRTTKAVGSTSKATGPTATRQRVQARSGRQRYQRKRAWWTEPIPILLFSVGGVAIIIGIFIAIAHNQGNSSAATHGPPAVSVLNAVEHPRAAIFGQVGAGSSIANLFKALPNKSGTGLPVQNGKPVLLYVGGEFCPFCAADRWSLIMALSRFGTFSGIETNSSSMTPEIYPGTSTFTFVKATYSSPYLIFDAKEIYGASQTTPLQSLNSAESTVSDTYDAPPYTAGGIPFLDFGGQYVTSGGSYDVGVLHVNPSDQYSQALTYAQIVSGLSSASNPVAQGIVGTANEFTAAICKMTNNSDNAVCSSGAIPQIESHLPSK
jgi:Domain of unknown function (DUF929)